MKFSRRQILQSAGTSLCGMLVAGCLSTANPGTGDNGTPQEDNDTDGSDPPDPGYRGGGPRVDEPPYEITEPECGDDTDRDPLWLCENMPAEPSVEFEQVETSSAIFADEGLRFVEQDGEDQYYATFIVEAGALDRLHDDASGAAVDLIEGVDFDTHVVLVAQTGWGSGSKTPHLKRIEETNEGIHAFGCYRQPCTVTTDHTVRTVVARLERPANLESSVVSLTVDPQTRITLEAHDW
jgi:hypothetical protein